MTEEFRVAVDAAGRHQWVRVDGELDLATAAPLEHAFDTGVVVDPGAAPVVFDLSGCAFIDSTGVRTVVQLGRRALDTGQAASIVCPPTAGARFTLDLLGVASSLPVHDSAEAVSADGGRTDGSVER